MTVIDDIFLPDFVLEFVASLNDGLDHRKVKLSDCKICLSNESDYVFYN